MNKKKATPIIDSRFLKILAVKKDDLKDSIVFICVDQSKFGTIDSVSVHKLVEKIDSVEPNAVYFPLQSSVDISFYDKDAFKNKNVLVTIGSGSRNSHIESEVSKILTGAKNIEFVYQPVSIEIKP